MTANCQFKHFMSIEHTPTHFTNLLFHGHHKLGQFAYKSPYETLWGLLKQGIYRVDATTDSADSVNAVKV